MGIFKFKIENCKLKIPAKRAGFTVLESLVAILILSLSISGAFSAIQQSLSQFTISKDEVRAFYLTQEAIEVIRNIRDNNQLTKINTGSGNWLYNITQGTSPYFCPFTTASVKNTCTIDATAANKISSCGAVDWGNCPNLKQDTSTLLYNHLSGNETGIKREIQIENVAVDSNNNPVEIAVTIRIAWKKGLLDKEFKVKTHLFNWGY